MRYNVVEWLYIYNLAKGRGWWHFRMSQEPMNLWSIQIQQDPKPLTTFGSRMPISLVDLETWQFYSCSLIFHYLWKSYYQSYGTGTVCLYIIFAAIGCYFFLVWLRNSHWNWNRSFAWDTWTLVYNLHDEIWLLDNCWPTWVFFN